MTEESQNSVQNEIGNTYHANRLKLPRNLLQTIQVETHRLKFLQNCRNLKRPPPSLRLEGGSALSSTLNIPLISELESKFLSIAIEEKTKKD